MRKLLTLLTTAMFLAPMAALAQVSPGEIITSAVIEVPSDRFKCRLGQTRCGLQVRVYNELDPTDFFGTANPVNGYPRYSRATKRYIGDAQLSGNYPSAMGIPDLNWYSAWGGVTDSDTFRHMGFYGAQSQVLRFGELGNSLSANCLPVVQQTACFGALSTSVAHDIDGFGPAGRAVSLGGLSPIPRPTVTYTSPSSIGFTWEQATTEISMDSAPSAIVGYRLFLTIGSRFDRLGPSEDVLHATTGSTLIDATGGVVLPATTTSFTLSASDPILAGYDPATQTLTANIRLVYAHDVLSANFSANSFPARFVDAADLVASFRGRAVRRGVMLAWTVDGLAGVRSFNVLRSDRSDGPFFPIDQNDIAVDGVRANYVKLDRVDRRLAGRASADLMYYRLEITGVDGTRTVLDPVEVNVRKLRRESNR